MHRITHSLIAIFKKILSVMLCSFSDNHRCLMGVDKTHRNSFSRHTKNISAILTVFLTIALLIGLTLNPKTVRVAQAGGKVWSTTADFSEWTHSNTEALNNRIVLEGSGRPEAVSTTAHIPFANEHSATVWDSTNSKAYIFGGYGGTGDEIIAFDPAAVDGAGEAQTLAATLPFPNYDMSAVWDPVGDKAYLFGGGSGSGDEIVIFDPAADGGNGEATISALQLPATGSASSAVWDSTKNVAYIFGGFDAGTSIYVFDPAANGGVGEVAIHSQTIPRYYQYGAAVWDPDAQKAYLFTLWSGNGDEIMVFDPNADSGNGTFTTLGLTLPFWNTGFSGIWDANQHKAYLFGGSGEENYDQIVIFDPSANGGSGSVGTSSLRLPSARTYSTAIWHDKSYIFGGSLDGIANDEIFAYSSSSMSYDASGEAHIVYAPLSGHTNDWQDASADLEANGQSASMSYTSNPDCTTGLTSDLSSVPNSESLCLKFSLTTVDPNASPALTRVSLTFATFGQSETKTWTSDSDFSSWSTSDIAADDNAMSLTSTDNVGTVSNNKSAVLPKPLSHSSVVWASNTNKFYLFGGAIGNLSAVPEMATNSIIEYDPETGSSTYKVNLPSPRMAASAVWDPVRNVAYIFGGSRPPSIGPVQYLDQILVFDPVANTVSSLLATLPSGRHATSAVWDAATSKAYIFGGSLDLATEVQIVEFDPAGNSGAGSVSIMPDVLPKELYYTSAVWDSNRNKAYIFGGKQIDYGSGNYSSSIIEYDPASGIRSFAATLPSGRSGVAAGWSSSLNKAYLFGGETGPANYTSQFVEFDPVANGGDGATAVKSGAFPTLRGYSAAALDPDNNRIFALGGMQTGSYCADQIIGYDPSQDLITTKSFLPSAKYGTSSVYDTNSGHIYIFGGSSLVNNDSGVEILDYDPESNTVTKKPETLPSSAFSTSAVWDPSQNVAYLFGGIELASYNQIIKYDPDLGSATLLLPTLPTSSRLTSAVWDSSQNVAYIFGGINGSTLIDSILKFDPAGNGGAGLVTTLPATLPSARRGSAAVWNPIQNKAYIFGGTANDFDDRVSPESTQLVEFDPAADGGNGTATIILEAPGSSYFGTELSAVWSTNRQKAYIFGADPEWSGAPTRNIIEYNPATNQINEISTPGLELPMYTQYSSAAWDSEANKAYVFGGNGVLAAGNNNPAISSYVLDPVAEFIPGRSVYAASGSATIAYTPFAGTAYDWLSASFNAELDHQVSLAYSNDETCTSGFVSDINLLNNSETICLKLSMTRTDGGEFDDISPILNDITLAYTASSGEEPPPPPSPSAILTVMAPNRGEEWAVGSNQTITFNLDGAVADHYHLYYSLDGGMSYPFEIAADVKTGTYTWTVPNAPSDTVKIKVVAEGPSNQEIAHDASDDSFSITVSVEPAVEPDSKNPTVSPDGTVAQASITNQAGNNTAEQTTSGTVSSSNSSSITEAGSPATQVTPPASASENGLVGNRTQSITGQGETGLLAKLKQKLKLVRPANVQPDTLRLVDALVLVIVIAGGLVQALLTSLSNLLTIFSLREIISDPIRTLRFLILGVTSSRQKRLDWGVVVEKGTGLPLPLTQVELVRVDSDGTEKVIERKFTDNDGTFGFTAFSGNYYLKISRDLYVVSKIDLFDCPTVEQKGQRLISVTKDAEFFIAPTVIMTHKEKQSKTILHIHNFLNLASKAVTVFSFALLSIGTLLCIYDLAEFGGWLSWVMLAFQLVIWIIDIESFIGERLWGLVIDDTISSPLSCAIIRVMNRQNGKLFRTSVSNQNGKFTILLKEGDYELMATKSGYQVKDEGEIRYNKAVNAVNRTIRLERI